MFDIGIPELIVIFVVALLVFGPKKLPELGMAMGKGIRELKKAMSEIKNEVSVDIHSDFKETIEQMDMRHAPDSKKEEIVMTEDTEKADSAHEGPIKEELKEKVKE